jgi:hypothetical protein
MGMGLPWNTRLWSKWTWKCVPYLQRHGKSSRRRREVPWNPEQNRGFITENWWFNMI